MYYENLQVLMNTETGQGKNFEIHLPSGQVIFTCLQLNITCPKRTHCLTICSSKVVVYKLIRTFNYFCHSSCSLHLNYSFYPEIM